MISKIINWVGGGLFRTIGRFIAFIIIGFILATIINKSNFNIDLSKYFGFEKVDALSLDGTPLGIQTPLWSDEYTMYLNNDRYGANQLTDTANFNTFTNTFNEMRYMVIPLRGFAQRLEQSNQSGTWLTDVELTMVIMTIEIKDNTTLQEYHTCELQNSLIVCPLLPNTGYNQLRIKAWLPDSQALTFLSVNEIQLKIGPKADIYRSSSQEIIINQNDNTQAIINSQQQQHNETMSYFTDTNSTETNATATSFFSNFTDTDHGGLSSIITAPLTTVNAMLSNQCVSPSATWKGATISLPCGDMFWNREGASGLKNLLNLFYGGFVCYYAIRRLFLLIEQLKDPTNDRIEVIDL